MAFMDVTYPTSAWINGQWHNTERKFSLLNPATKTTTAEVADCGLEEAKLAIHATAKAFEDWRHTTAYERSAILVKFAEMLKENKERLARLMTEEVGKPIRESRGEVDYATGFVQWYAEEAKRLYGETIPSSFPNKRLRVDVAPVGPVYAITPWNFPAAMVTRKLAPALAAGCTFTLKPPAQSPLTPLVMAELLAEAGLPAGVFQVLPTKDAATLSRVFLEDHRIRKLAFTGSTATGIRLAAKAAETVKRVSLELGGHAPFIVFADADLRKAAAEAISCKFRNAGQTCVCTNRIYVQQSVVEEFITAFIAEVRKLQLGLPAEDTTDIGPLVNEQGYDKAKEHIQDAVSLGAQVAYQAAHVPDSGYYVPPTVLTRVTREMKISYEETFGPVAPIFTFSDETDALAQANDTMYGLAAYIFTQDVGRVYRLTEGLDYGIIGVNDGVPSTPQAPFGGMKASGYGREGGRHGIEEYIERKFVSIKL